MNSYSDNYSSEFSDIEENFGNQQKNPCMSKGKVILILIIMFFLAKSLTKRQIVRLEM
jgi:hypothetical protein